MDIQLANTLFDNGTLSALYKAGFVSEKVFIYRDIYLWIDAQIKARRISRCEAISEAQSKFECDRRTIYRALSCFKQDDL